MSDIVKAKEEAKKVIRSLLISAPKGLTLSMLKRDYYAMTKDVFPYQKFGFLTAVDFAKSLTDILHVKRMHNELVFYGIADEKTEHIMRMVQKQKKPKMYNQLLPKAAQNHSSKKITANLHSKDSSTICYPSALVRSGIHKVVKSNMNGIPMTDVPQLYKEVNGFELSESDILQLPNLILQMPDVACLEFGRTNRQGSNLYLHPSKSVMEYKELVKNKVRLDQTMVHLSQCSDVQAKNSAAVPTSIAVSAQLTIKSTSGVSTSFSSADNSVHVSSINDSLKPLPVNDSNPSQPLTTKRSPVKFSIKSQTSVVEPSIKINEIFQSEHPPLCRQLQEEIVLVLSEHKMGLWARRLPELYKKKFKRELELMKFGYNSIIEFISTMSDRVSICRPEQTSDWMLSLRKPDTHKNHVQEKQLSTAVPVSKLTQIENELKMLFKRFTGGIVLKSLADIYQMHYGKKLPYMEMGFTCVEQLVGQYLDRLELHNDKMHLRKSSDAWSGSKEEHSIPIDAVGSGVCYNPPLIPTVKWDYFDIFISHVVSPSTFMFQLIGVDTTVALDKLMDQMEKCYASSEGKTYRMPLKMVHVGQICVTIYHGDKNWNRAIVTKEPENGFVEVLYVDYGDTATVSVHCLFLIKSEFQSLPAQFIRGRLSHLQPPDMLTWPGDCRRVMLEFCRNKSLVALATDVDEQKVVSLLVCDTGQSSTVDVYLNDVLIERGLALHINDESAHAQVQSNPNCLKNQPTTILQPPVSHHSHCTSPKDVISDDPPPYHLHAGDIPSSSGASGVPVLSVTNVATSNETYSSGAGYIGSHYVPPPPGFIPPETVYGGGVSLLIQQKRFSTTAEFLLFQADQGNNTQSKDEDLVKFIQVFHFSDLTFHVISHESDFYLTSAEISSIFRPDVDDLLQPLMFIRKVSFVELVVRNTIRNAQLFQEFKRFKVKGAVDGEHVEQCVTLYKLSDVPDMLKGIGHPDCAGLVEFFTETFLSLKFDTTATDDHERSTRGYESSQCCLSKDQTKDLIRNKAQVDGLERTSGHPTNCLTSQRPSSSPPPCGSTTGKMRVPDVKDIDPNIPDLESSPYRHLVKIDVLKALLRTLIQRREEMLAELLENPSPELLKKMETIFLRIKIAEQAIDAQTSQCDVRRYDNIRESDVCRTTDAPDPCQEADDVTDCGRNSNIHLSVIPPEPPTSSAPFTALPSTPGKATPSILKVTSPPFKPATQPHLYRLPSHLEQSTPKVPKRYISAPLDFSQTNTRHDPSPRPASVTQRPHSVCHWNTPVVPQLITPSLTPLLPQYSRHVAFEGSGFYPPAPYNPQPQQVNHPIFPMRTDGMHRSLGPFL